MDDLGSTNGTFVDGTRLGGEPVPLNNGQIIQLGSNVTLLFQQLSDDSDVMATMFSTDEEDPDAATALYDYESDPAMQIPSPEELEPKAAPPPPPPPARRQSQPERPQPNMHEQSADPQISYSPPPLPQNDQFAQQEAAAYDEAKKKQRRNYIIIGVLVGILFLCCLCAALIGALAYIQNTGVLDLPTAYLPASLENALL